MTLTKHVETAILLLYPIHVCIRTNISSHRAGWFASRTGINGNIFRFLCLGCNTLYCVTSLLHHKHDLKQTRKNYPDKIHRLHRDREHRIRKKVSSERWLSISSFVSKLFRLGSSICSRCRDARHNVFRNFFLKEDERPSLNRILA